MKRYELHWTTKVSSIISPH